MHRTTNDGRTYSLRVDLISYLGEERFALYNTLRIGPESDSYRLTVARYNETSTLG